MLLIFGALRIELAGIIRSIRISKKIRTDKACLYEGRSGNRNVLIVVTGMGKDNAVRAAEIALRQKGVSGNKNLRFLVTGFCGACRRNIKVGDLVYYTKVIVLPGETAQDTGRDKEKPGAYIFGDKKPAITPAQGMKTVTCGCTRHLVSTREEKKMLFEEKGAEVVDMESYWIIEQLVKNGISLDKICCIRSVSDDAGTNLPPFFGTGDMTLALSGLLKSFFTRRSPGYGHISNIKALKNISIAKRRISKDLIRLL